MAGLAALTLAVCLAVEPPAAASALARAPDGSRRAAIAPAAARAPPAPRARRRAHAPDAVLALPMFVPVLLPFVLLFPPQRLEDPPRPRRTARAAREPRRSDP